MDWDDGVANDWTEDADTPDPGYVHAGEPNLFDPARPQRSRPPLGDVPDHGRWLGHYNDTTSGHQHATRSTSAKPADPEGERFGDGERMATISAVLLTVLGRGGHLLAQSSLYGGTHSSSRTTSVVSLSHTFIDATRPDGGEGASPETKAIGVEAPPTCGSTWPTRRRGALRPRPRPH